jgi:hypothetical protein
MQCRAIVCAQAPQKNILHLSQLSLLLVRVKVYPTVLVPFQDSKIDLKS